MEVNFYGVLQKETERVVASLLDQAYSIGKNSALLVSNDSEAEFFDAKLWSLIAWLPHCRSSETYEEKASVVIHNMEKSDNINIKNNSQYLFLFNSVEYFNLSNFEKVYVIFDLNNSLTVKYNRDRWKKLQQDNYNLSFYKQNIEGNFEKRQI